VNWESENVHTHYAFPTSLQRFEKMDLTTCSIPPLDAPIISSQQQQQQQQQPVAAPESANQLPADKVDNAPTASPSEQKASDTTNEQPQDDDTPSKSVQTNKGRCFKCRVKVSLWPGSQTGLFFPMTTHLLLII
jgi:hypothetical protein